MLLKYNIDIGPTKAPLGNTHKEWDEQKVIEIMKSLESIVSKLKQNNKISYQLGLISIHH